MWIEPSSPKRVPVGEDVPSEFREDYEESVSVLPISPKASAARHSWLESEGFSLSAANADVQELPATLYH